MAWSAAGNHDLFALLDATLVESAGRPMGGPAYEYSYAFAHPQSYLESGWSPKRADDEELLAAMLAALQHSYRRPGGAGRAQVTAQPQRPRSQTPPSRRRANDVDTLGRRGAGKLGLGLTKSVCA